MATYKEIKEYAKKLKDMNAEAKKKRLEEYEAGFRRKGLKPEKYRDALKKAFEESYSK